MFELEEDRGFLAENLADFGSTANSETWNVIESKLAPTKSKKKRGLIILFFGSIASLIAAILILFNSSLSSLDFKSKWYPSFNFSKKSTPISKETIHNDSIKFAPIQLDFFPKIIPTNYSFFGINYPFNQQATQFYQTFINPPTIYATSNSEEVDFLKAKELTHIAKPIPKYDKVIKKRFNSIRLSSGIHSDFRSVTMENTFFPNSGISNNYFSYRLTQTLSFHQKINDRFSWGFGINYSDMRTKLLPKVETVENPFVQLQSVGISLHPEWTIFKRNRFEINAQFTPEINYYFHQFKREMTYIATPLLVDSFVQTEFNEEHKKMSNFGIGYGTGLNINYWINSSFKIHFSPQINGQVILNKTENNFKGFEQIKYGTQIGLSYHF